MLEIQNIGMTGRPALLAIRSPGRSHRNAFRSDGKAPEASHAHYLMRSGRPAESDLLHVDLHWSAPDGHSWRYAVVSGGRS